VVEYEKPRPQIPIGWAEARRQVTRTQTHRPQIGEARHDPSRCRASLPFLGSQPKDEP